MSIERRIEGALSDLKLALGEGDEVEEALKRVAVDYDLKPEAVRVRAEKAFGDLSSVESRVAFEQAVGSRKALLRAAFVKYRLISLGLTTEHDRVVPDAFAASLERDFEFSPTERPGTLGAELERVALYQEINAELDRLLNNAPNQ